VRDRRADADVIQQQNGLEPNVCVCKDTLLAWGLAFSLPPGFEPALSGLLLDAGQKPGGRLKA